MSQTPHFQRSGIALAIGVAAFSLCLAIHWDDPTGAGDFEWSLSAARDLLAGRDPYNPVKADFFIYPLPAAMLAMPLAALEVPPALAGALFFGLSSLVLAWSALAEGARWRLLAFLSYPYVWALVTVQWSPLLLAAAFAPSLYPLVIVKPHVGLPVALARFSKRGLLTATAFGLLSLLLMPDWPVRWVSRLGLYGSFGSFIPLLTLPVGPVLLTAFRFWREPPARLLGLLALAPQRAYYDALLLWGAPQSRRSSLALTLISWLMLPTEALRTLLPVTVNDSVMWFAYLPALILLFWDLRDK